MLKNILKQLWSRQRNRSEAPSGSATALALLEQGRLVEAEAALRVGCAAQPNDAEAWHLLGHVLNLRGNTGEAIVALERASTLAPENADGLYSLGSAYRATDDPVRAIEVFQRITELQPLWFAPWIVLADLYAGRDRVDDAEDMYRRALTLAPQVAETHYNFGNLLLRCGSADDALVHYREAVALQPSFARAYSNLLCALNYADSAGTGEIRDAHFEFDSRYAGALEPPQHAHPIRSAHDRTRLGYVSPDFRNHAVGRLVEPALKHHDRERFEVYCYSDVKRPDDRTARFRSYAAHWRDITSKDDDAVAEAIRDDEIDILVDLTGHTDDHRLLVFARRPAPVQVTWIGYPNTTGLRAMDYRITDGYADPPGSTEHLHRERLLRLPEIYLPCEKPEDEVAVTPPPSLSRGYATFGSFNNLMKVSGRTIELWARVLRALPGSRLMAITVPEGRTRARLREAFAQHGVGAERLDLRGRLTHPEFLQAHADVDVALDTYPYHGTTTTAHTLWMGLPLVTLAGSTHLSRVGVSMLANTGLGDLVADTDDQFVQIAISLATDASRLAHLRTTLRQRVEAGPLMDGPRFTRHLEAAYESIREEHCRIGQ